MEGDYCTSHGVTAAINSSRENNGCCIRDKEKPEGVEFEYLPVMMQILFLSFSDAQRHISSAGSDRNISTTTGVIGVNFGKSFDLSKKINPTNSGPKRFIFGWMATKNIHAGNY